MATDFSQYAVPDSAPAPAGGTDFSQYLAQPTPAPAAPVSGAMATTRGLINGATVGFGPKASAAGRAYLVNPVEDALHAIGVGPGSTGQTYSQMRDEEMAANSEAAKQHPIAYLAGDVAGGLPLGAVAKTGLAANAAIGSVRGGNSGAPGDTLTNMAEGGALGTAGAYLGRGVANLGKNAADKLVDAVSNAYKITREEAKAALVSHFGGTGVPATTTLAPVAGQVANVPSAAVSALASKVNIPAAVAGFVGGTNTAHPILGTAAGLVPYAGTVLKIAGENPAAQGVLARTPVQAAGGLVTQAAKGPVGVEQSLALTQLRNSGLLQDAGSLGAQVPAVVGGEVQQQADTRSRIQQLSDSMRARWNL